MPKRLKDIRSTEYIALGGDIEPSNPTGNVILSNPPEGMNKVVNIFVKDGKAEIQYDDQPDQSGVLVSEPPANSFRVTNLFVDPLTGRLTIQYDNQT